MSLPLAPSLLAAALALGEVAELNPRFDADGRTARVAARLVEQLGR